MRPQKRQMPFPELMALFHKLAEVPALNLPTQPSTSLIMADADFNPTQNMEEVRFIVSVSACDFIVLQVDGANNAILLEPDYSKG